MLRDELVPLREEDFKVWKGANIQAFSTIPPKPEETRLALYLINLKDRTFKEFRQVNKALTLLLNRKISMVAYGSKGKEAIFKVIIRWEQ
jgi:hypothetical protein